MRISNYGEDFTTDGGLHVDLGEYEHVTVMLPSGHRVDVFANEINVAEPGTHGTRDGKRIWGIRP